MARPRGLRVALAAIAVAVSGALAAPSATADMIPTVSVPTGEWLISDYRAIAISYATTSDAASDGKFIVEFDFDAESTSESSFAIGYDTFRLEVDGQKESPTSATQEAVNGWSHVPGTVSFEIPTTTAEATLLVYFTADSVREIPVTFTGGVDPQDDPVASEADGTPPPPTIELVGILGGVSVEVTDHSGIDSTCTYASPPTYRTFRLPADDTASVVVVPLAQLGITYYIDIDCDNGAHLGTTATW